MQHRRHRKPANFTVELVVNRVSFELRLVDVTPRGVKLAGTHDVVDGTAGEIRIRGRSLPGFLRWVEGGDIGFEFEDDLPADIFALLARQRAVSGKKRRHVIGYT